jgi:hypothetical protein
MGAVWRIIYDDRLTQDDLIDDLNKNNPAPILEDDLPAIEPTADDGTSNHDIERGGLELAEANALAHWYCRLVNDYTGELRIVNERAIQDAAQCQDVAAAKAAAQSHLKECRDNRRSAPPTMATFKQLSQR